MLIAVLALPAMLAFVGVGVDSLFAFTVREKLQKSLDAAGLAAAHTVEPEAIAGEARRYFDVNFTTSGELASITDFNVLVSGSQEFVTLSATARMPTSFMSLLGIASLDVNARTKIHREVRGMELALVMDNTGSMRSGGKIAAMKSAARELIDLVYGDAETRPNLWVSVVPYTATVNVGEGRTDWVVPASAVAGGEPPGTPPIRVASLAGRMVDAGGLDAALLRLAKKSDDGGGAPPPDSGDPYAPSRWKGCVEARSAPFDQSDDPPSSRTFTQFLYRAARDNAWPPLDERNAAQNNGTGPNLGCGPAITSLAAAKASAVAAIDEMQPWHRGGTTGNLGLVWGWRTLSPQWRGLWGGATPASLPLDYGTPLMDKVVVMLTDGQNQFYDWPGDGAGPGGSDYTAYGRLDDFGYPTLGAARREIDRRMAATCTAMKAEGITLYTVTFGSTPDSDTQALYRDCASQPEYYFHSPDSATLSKAFRFIGMNLSRLRIVE